MDKLNIMIVGVGGQGSLLASRMIGTAALKKSYDVKVSEVHGMSQRGGSVVTYVKLGEKVNSPLIEKGEADIITFTIQLDDLGMYSGYTEEFLTFMERFKPEQTGRFKPPPPVIIAYGTLYRKGLITSMRLKRDRFDPTSLSTIRATLDISIKSLPDI